MAESKLQKDIPEGNVARDNVFQGRGENFDHFVTGMSEAGNAVVNGAKKAGQKVGNVASGAYNGAKNAASNPPARRDLVDSAQWVEDKMDQTKESIGNTKDSMKQRLNDTIESNKPLSEVVHGAQTMGTGLDDAKDSVSNAAHGVVDAATDAKNKVENTGAEVGQGLKGAATGAVQGFEQGKDSASNATA
ncbi:hypothetical protein GYMLUDRAFT_45782 [Collybiopsis luxurians FD-317 M1]|uniref:Uncharacterized protein n=1 Tax=Collybiopsis luxurians FD-317 M1 TaxID=944289 RepID=A0A0D0BQZ4_9AGAR|nr:hypothetical protein GYMLUDRAFT_45782 [Collybiopsis luxurians FD-317 M1]